MKTQKTLIFLFFLLFCSTTYANTKVISALKEGGKLIFIRHAYAPGGGDPDNFNIRDCSTQRNLDSTGIDQAKRIGKFFRTNQISVDLVLSSEWCRCKDTAKIAFKEFETYDSLNSFYDERFSSNKSTQIKKLKEFIKNWNSNKNLVLVTHFVVIQEMLKKSVSSGEFVITDKNLNIIGSIKNN